MMSVDQISDELRVKDAFHHIDAGFLNRRLALRALPKQLVDIYHERAEVGSDHMTVLRNDHLLVTMLEDLCEHREVPTLFEALELDEPHLMFRSTERLTPCPEIYDEKRVEHEVLIPFELEKPVKIAYHTTHLVSDTGTMTLSEGSSEGYVESIIGILHKENDFFRVEPIVIGAPWFDHPRNGDDCPELMWAGQDFGEILVEDIEQFSDAKHIKITNESEWQDVMSKLPEKQVKEAIAGILAEPVKKDWGGESDDHFSASTTIGGRRKTTAFLLKGPSNFREMTLEMCGKRADQIYRLAKTGAEVLVVQHSHLIGDAVRETLRAFAIQPGGKSRKYCVMDGMCTYRVLKAYGKLS